jgi:hypothetical protein
MQVIYGYSNVIKVFSFYYIYIIRKTMDGSVKINFKLYVFYV